MQFEVSEIKIVENVSKEWVNDHSSIQLNLLLWLPSLLLIYCRQIDIKYICKELVERSKNYTTEIIAKDIYNNLENI